MNAKRIGLAALVLTGIAAPAVAHHSFAMFDQSKTVTLKGVVRELEWTNPHVWIRVMVPDQATGKPLQYAFEMGSVPRSTYDGWKKDTVKPGDAITLTIHPLKDGSRGGMYLAAQLADGTKLGRTGPAVGRPTARLPGQTGGPPLE
ncbi:MAG TPA: DUF6152 family protein [Micropepsaceae bacterium]|nr:DUF6152 family protein [Micropepsaceae bacterium]